MPDTQLMIIYSGPATFDPDAVNTMALGAMRFRNLRDRFRNAAGGPGSDDAGSPSDEQARIMATIRAEYPVFARDAEEGAYWLELDGLATAAARIAGALPAVWAAAPVTDAGRYAAPGMTARMVTLDDALVSGSTPLTTMHDAERLGLLDALGITRIAGRLREDPTAPAPTI